MPTNIGNWWNANEEVDLVVLVENDAILVSAVDEQTGEVLMFWQRRAEVNLIRPELIRLPCARSGFTPQLRENIEQRHDVVLLDLRDVWDKNPIITSGFTR